MQINDDLINYFIKDFRMYNVLRNTARKLNDKRIKKRKQKLLKIKQFLRIACS